MNVGNAYYLYLHIININTYVYHGKQKVVWKFKKTLSCLNLESLLKKNSNSTTYLSILCGITKLK